MTEQEILKNEYEKSKCFENPESRIQVLEDFKILTDSSSLPVEIKDRFHQVADKDISQQVAVLQGK